MGFTRGEATEKRVRDSGPKRGLADNVFVPSAGGRAQRCDGGERRLVLCRTSPAVSLVKEHVAKKNSPFQGREKEQVVGEAEESGQGTGVERKKKDGGCVPKRGTESGY